MRIALERDGKTPLYQQIEAYLRQAILAGSLPPETRLPASRQLAGDLGVNRITVEKAYAGLEADGLVFSQVGSGTYVLPPPGPPQARAAPDAPWPLWQQELQARQPVASAPAPEILLAEAGHPDPIDFSSGSGDAQRFPVEDLRKVIQAILRRDGIAALEYGERGCSERGYTPLRSTIAQVLASQGLPAGPENILITSGSQQALALAAQALLQPGEVVLVESPTYSGALELFRLLGLRIAGVPVDDNGLQIEKLEALLQQQHPKLIYTIPNFHNPTGVCLNASRRRQLVELAGRYNLPILEDDFVGDLRYEGRAQPALKALDPDGRVIYTSTFSKMLMPGLRVGFLVASGPVYERLVAGKRLSDLATSSLTQRALEAYVTVGRYQAHLRRSCQVYHKRRDAMLQAIRRYLPGGVQLTPPLGGLFVWLRLPGALSASELLPLACEQGVAFAPGERFFPADGPMNAGYLRLNFAVQTPERIQAGIQRLGKALRRLKAGAA